MKFMFEDELDLDSEVQARRRPVGVYVGLATALLLAVGVAGWFVLAKPGGSAAPDAVPTMAATDSAAATTPATSEADQTPSDSSAPAAPDTQIATDPAAAARAEPVEEVLDSAPAVTAATPPAPAVTPAFTPVTVPRVPDAAPAPGDTTAQAPLPAQRRKPRTDDAPWPPVERAPQPQADPVARLRGALAQCAAMSNQLSRGNCLARTRQNFCGDAWGRIPECPAGN